MTCLRCHIRLQHSKNATMKDWHARDLGQSHGASIVDMEGIPRTAEAHGQCLLTSKELTSKVKTSRDARFAVIPADTVDNPQVGWIVWKKRNTWRNCRWRLK